MNAYKIVSLVIVTLVLAILLGSALNSYTRVADSALAQVSPPLLDGGASVPRAERSGGVGGGGSSPRTAPGKNYLPIIFLNSATAGGAWLLSGNVGTSATTDFLGTTDNISVTFRVSNTVALRLAPPNIANNTPNIIGGSFSNTIPIGNRGSFIGGGGSTASPNILQGSNSVIVGGTRNTLDFSDDSFIGGGFSNTITSHEGIIVGGGNNVLSGDHGVIVGGTNHQNQGDNSFIGSGFGNIINATGAYATIGGGYQNMVSGSYAAIGGGYQNNVGGFQAVIGGGASNTATGAYSMVGGGHTNDASGNYAMIPGGFFNSATMTLTFAAGNHAKANHTGTFVWGDDSTNVDFTSTGTNQFLIRAKGFVGINTNNPTRDLTISSDSAFVTGIDLYNTTSVAGTVGYRLQVNGSSVTGRIGNFELWDNGLLMTIQPGGNVGLGGVTSPSNILTLPNNADTSGRGLANAWNTYSSRRWKTNITTLPDALSKIAQLRGVTFDWKANGTHDIGLIAEEVGQVFPEVVTYEANGVDAQAVDYARLVAVLIEGVKAQQNEIKSQQATLDEIRRDKDTRLAAQQDEIAQLKNQNANLDARLTVLEQAQGTVNALPLSRDVLFIGTLVVIGLVVIGRRKR